MKRVHIVGAPRSGTTLMLELMANGFAFDAFAKDETSVCKLPDPGAATTLSKFPREVALAEPLLALDPGQWFVFMRRDPRDVIVSRHPGAPDRYWLSLFHYRRALERIKGALGHPRLIEVRYERLVREPDAVQRELAERLDFLPIKTRFSEFHLVSQPSALSRLAMHSLRPVDADSVGAWRRHKPRLAGQIAQHGSVTPDLVAQGYEPDAAWEAELEGVEPDLGPGFWPEKSESPAQRDYDKRMWAAFEQYVARRGLAGV